MNSDHDLDRRLEAFLHSGPSDLPDSSFDAVRDHIDQTGQRVVIGPWRIADTMNKLLAISLGAAAVVAALIIGSQVLGPPATGVGAAPSVAPSPTTIDASVEFFLDGGSATTEITAVADGASLSGTAVTTFRAGIHTVQLECSARDGDTWALAGTIERTSVPSERAGAWSAVIVRDGSPQQIGIWLSDPKAEGVGCEGWVTGLPLADIGAENFQPVESGVLTAPPDPAPVVATEE